MTKRKLNSISVDEVKEVLRRGRGGEIRNCSGWSVFYPEAGQPKFIVDDENGCTPVPYTRLKSLSVSVRRVARPTVADFLT
jgi:hypothetical protein